MKKYLSGLVFLSLFLALAGFGCKSLSPAEQVILEMKKKMVEVKSASVAFNYEGRGSDFVKDPTLSPLTAGPVTFKFLGQFAQSEVGFDMGGAFDFTTIGQSNNHLAGEIRNVGQDQYAIFSTLDLDQAALPAAVSGVDFSTFLEKWFFTQAPVAPSDQSELTSSEKLKIYRAFLKTDLFSEIEELGEEEGGGVAALKYRVVLDEDSLVGLAKKISSIMEEKFVESDEADFREMVSKLNENKITIWVGKSDKLLHRLTFEPGESGSLIVLALSDFNQPVTIEVPADAVSFDTFLMSNLGGGSVELPSDLPSNVIELPEGLKDLTPDGQFGQREFDEFQKLFEGQAKP